MVATHAVPLRTGSINERKGSVNERKRMARRVNQITAVFASTPLKKSVRGSVYRETNPFLIHEHHKERMGERTPKQREYRKNSYL